MTKMGLAIGVLALASGSACAGWEPPAGQPAALRQGLVFRLDGKLAPVWSDGSEAINAWYHISAGTPETAPHLVKAMACALPNNAAISISRVFRAPEGDIRFANVAAKDVATCRGIMFYRDLRDPGLPR